MRSLSFERQLRGGALEAPAGSAGIRRKERSEFLHRWIKVQGAPETGRRYIGRIVAFARSLDLAAERGQSLADIRPGLRAIPFESVNLAVLVKDDVVVVLRVFHGSQDLLKELQRQFGQAED